MKRRTEKKAPQINQIKKNNEKNSPAQNAGDNINVAISIKRRRFLIRLSNILMFAVIAALLVAFIIGLYRLGVIRLPNFIDITQQNKPTQGIDEADIFYSALHDGKYPENAALTYDIAEEDYLRKIAEAPYVDEYTMKIRVSVSEGTHRSTIDNQIWVSGNKYRIDKYSGSSKTMSIVCNGENISVTDYVSYDEPITRKFPVSEEFDVASQANIPSLDSFTAETDGEDIKDVSIVLIRSQNSNVYQISYNTPIGNKAQSEKLLVSLEYGLIVGAESKVDNQTVYTASVTSVSRGLKNYGGDMKSIFGVY